MSGIGELLPRRCLPPLWRELSELPRLSWGTALPAPAPGAGAPVMLIPGFMAGDNSLGHLAARLTAAGHVVWPAGIACNADCSERTVTRLVRRLEDAADRGGRPLAIVGHSRGGILGRVLATRRPELVSALVTLGAPHQDHLAVHPLIWAHACGLAVLSRLGIGGLLGFGCAGTRCCSDFARDMRARVDGVPFVSVYSRRDGVVDWRACMDPAARNVPVDASHCGMPRHPSVQRLLLAALASVSAPG